MPVSTRRGGTAGGNAFAITTVDLRVPGDPIEAVAIVHEALAAVKGGGSMDLVGQLAMVVNLLPTSVLTSFAKEARPVEHTSELQSLMRISYAVFCLKKK